MSLFVIRGMRGMSVLCGEEGNEEHECYMGMKWVS